MPGQHEILYDVPAVRDASGINFFRMPRTKPVMRNARIALPALLLTACLLGAARAAPVDFTLTDLTGSTIKLSDYRGQWVVINFWASWCPPCIRELPELVAYQAANPKVQVLGVNFEESTIAEARTFLEPFNVNFPNLKIGDTPLQPFEPLEGLPTTAIIDPDGELVERHMGPVTAEHLEKLVELYQQRSR